MTGLFDANTSSWIVEAPPDTPAPPLAKDLEVDVAIIGGGFTGVSTAYHLSRRFPNLGIALLEATQLGNGASGRNGGLVLNGITVKDVDPSLVAREHAITRQAIDDIEALIRDHQLPVRFRRTGCVHLATTARAAEEAEAFIAQLAPHGLPLQYLQGAALASMLTAQHVHGAIFDPTEASIAGVDLVRAMRPLLVRQGVHIFEGTHVTRIREGATCALVTPGGTVRAKAIVLATSGYTMHLGYFKTGLLPVISHVVATAPVEPAILERTGLGRVAGFFDDSPRLAYGAVDPAGRVIFGGGSTSAYAYRFGNVTRYDARPDDTGAHAVRASLDRYFPELAGVATQHRWSGPLDLTLVRHCAIGVMGEHRNIFYGVGYSGHGITLANLAGKVITDLYAGDHDRWKDAAFYMRRPGGIPREPLRWLGYHLYTRLTGKSPFKRLD
ncbi:MAG: FAD-binding oxidoreductase [Kofleriaceae bacterium]|nr:FAD-binding oxidoreductase [Kofleriaceae bacterium]